MAQMERAARANAQEGDLAFAHQALLLEQRRLAELAQDRSRNMPLSQRRLSDVDKVQLDLLWRSQGLSK